jgi:hypothetical protein
MIFLKLSSEVSFNSDYHEYNNNHQLNYQFVYNHNFSKFNINFVNKLQKANNKIFDQVNSLNEFNTRVGMSQNRINHGLLLTYKKKYDHYPQYQTEGDITNNQYFTGYFLDLSLTDSLSTSAKIEYTISEEDNPNVTSKDFSNKGYKASISSYYGFEALGNDFNLNFNYDNDNRTRNYKNQLDAIFNHNLDNEYIFLNNQILYQISQDDIYRLIDNDYQQTDTQNRDNFQIITQVANNYGEKLFGMVESIFRKNNNRLNNSNNKTSKDESLDLSANFDYQIHDKINFLMENNYSFSNKYLSASSNNRESDTKKVKFGVSFSDAYFDSLSVSQSIEKTSTNFPNATYGFDNDYVSEITSIDFRKLFSETVNFDNRLNYSKIQEIYINSKYSASNNIKTSYSYYPTIDILLGDNFLISQLYSIRIDYDDYVYDTLTNLYDRFYRQVSAEYRIRYDNSPVRADLSRSIWKKPSSIFFKRNNVNVMLSYKYFANETGNKSGDLYDITGANKKHDLYLLAEKNFGPINLSLKPKAGWGNAEIYEIESAFTYNKSEDSKLSISFKPKYEVERDEFVYTIDTMIGIRF